MNTTTTGKHYNIQTDMCKDSKQCDRYKQVVAAQTRWVGCAAVGCEKLYTDNGEWHFSKLLVCKYAPTAHGGIIRRPYFQGEPCSQCRPRERCLFGLCIHPDDAKQLERLMQKPRGKTGASYGLFQEPITSEETYVSVSNSPADQGAQYGSSDTIEFEKVPDDKFFDDYEFDNYEPEDYEVVNFEINSPDIEAFEGIDSSSISDSSSDSNYNYSDGASTSLSYYEDINSTDPNDYEKEDAVDDMPHKFIIDKYVNDRDLEFIFPTDKNDDSVGKAHLSLLQLIHTLMTFKYSNYFRSSPYGEYGTN